jgi:hypothetical protein
MQKQPTDEEIALAVEAVRAAEPAAEIVAGGVGEAWASDHPKERLIFLSARPRSSLAPGEVYVTWVVTLYRGAVTEVTRFESRACDVP